MASITAYGIKKAPVIGRKKCGTVVCNPYLEKCSIASISFEKNPTNVHQPPFSQHQGKILKICWRTENLLFQNLKIMILQQNNYQYK